MKKFTSSKDGSTIYVPESEFDATLLSLNKMPRFSESVTSGGKPAKRIKPFAQAIEPHIDEAVRKYNAKEAGPQAIFAEFMAVRV